jgi:ferredoxin
MKVVVDLQLCEGNARCMEAAPEVFDVGEDDKARLLMERPGEALREKVKLAVRMCPRQAIALKEE